MARKVTAHLFSSINGVVENPETFQFDAFGPEEGELMGKAISAVTDVVFGRKLWQEWKDYWTAADAGDPFAKFINPVRKHVLSSTLDDELDWNSTLAAGDAITYMQQLRDSGEGDIAVMGGIETIRSLFTTGLIDTLTLQIHPVATDHGRRLFDESVPLTRLQLLDSTITSADNVILTYGLRTE